MSLFFPFPFFISSAIRFPCIGFSNRKMYILTNINRESFGEDIAATESDRSLEDDDYDYSDDFIDDGEISVVPNTSCTLLFPYSNPLVLVDSAL